MSDLVDSKNMSTPGDTADQITEKKYASITRDFSKGNYLLDFVGEIDSAISDNLNSISYEKVVEAIDLLMKIKNIYFSIDYTGFELRVIGDILRMYDKELIVEVSELMDIVEEVVGEYLNIMKPCGDN